MDTVWVPDFGPCTWGWCPECGHTGWQAVESVEAGRVECNHCLALLDVTP